MKKTIEQRTPKAGDIWFVEKASGAQESVLVIQAFDTMAITTRLQEKRPKYNAADVEGQFIDCKMLNYTYFARFDCYDGGIKQETLDAIQKAILATIIPGVAVPDAALEIKRVKDAYAKLEEDAKVKDNNARAVADALRAENEELKARLDANKDDPEKAEALAAIQDLKELLAQARDELAQEKARQEEHEKKQFAEITKILAKIAELTAERNLLKELYTDLLKTITGTGKGANNETA